LNILQLPSLHSVSFYFYKFLKNKFTNLLLQILFTGIQPNGAMMTFHLPQQDLLPEIGAGVNWIDITRNISAI